MGLAALRWALPGGGVLVIAAAAERWAPPPVLAEAARGYPWVAFAVTVALAALYHRTRPACLALLLAGVAWGAGAGSGDSLGASLLGTTVALVAGLLALTRDRGIAAPAGLGQLGFTALVGGAGVTAAAAPPEAVRTLFSTPSFPPGLTAWTGLPEMAALVYALGGAGVAYGALRHGGPVERALPWFLVAVGVALHVAPDPGSRMLWLMAASVVLALSLVETSYAMAYRDDLTGLPGRRALTRDLEEMGGRWAVAMVDVDHFKSFNDRHGHDVGDQVLRMVGGRLARAPGGARGYRYGGEEFTLLFPGKGRDEALAHLEAVRASVEQATFALRGWKRPAAKPKRPGKHPAPRRLSVTVSIGVSEAAPGDPSPEAALKRADEALYRAKRGGRNRVAT
ncbi:MAG: hypothetical protein AMXMBFR53_35180 [Gemmatimonadota bacterium]